MNSYEAKELKVVTADPQLTQARFSVCGRMLLGASYDGRVRRWDASGADLPESAAIEGHGGWVTAIATTTHGELLFSGDSWGQLRCTPYIGEKPASKWSVAQAHDGWLRDVAVSPDGTRIATSGMDKRVRVWSAADGSKQADFAIGERPAFAPRNGCNDGDVSRVQFTPDGNHLLLADLKGGVHLWDLAAGKSVRKFDAGSLFKLDRLQDVGGVRCLAVDKEQKLLAVGGTTPKNGGTVVGPPTLLVFDYASGELKYTLQYGDTNDCWVSDVAFHADGFVMVVCCGTPGSGKLAFQRLDEKEPMFTSKKMINCQSLAAHPDGKRLAVVATNAGSNGNGRPLNKMGEYEGNKSPIFVMEVNAKA